MGVADEVRSLFAGCRFGPPSTEAAIRQAETALGEALPPVLRELYLAFDGFLGPTDAAFFWPLLGLNGLVAYNLSYRGGFRLRDDFAEEFAKRDPFGYQAFVSQCLLFGDNGCGQYWGFKRDLPGSIILWDTERGVDYQLAGGSPLEVWQAEKQAYDAIDEEA